MSIRRDEEEDGSTHRMFFCDFCNDVREFNTKAYWLHCQTCHRCYTCGRKRSEKCTTCVVYDAKIKEERRAVKLCQLSRTLKLGEGGHVT